VSRLQFSARIPDDRLSGDRNAVEDSQRTPMYRWPAGVDFIALPIRFKIQPSRIVGDIDDLDVARTSGT
jgi:hypothetical protein